MKALAFLLFLASAALGGWALWEHSERVRVEEELASTARERDTFKKTARENVSLLAQAAKADIKASGPTGLTDQLKDLGITLNDDQAKKSGENPKVKTPGGKGLHPEGPDMTKLLKDPAARQALRAQADAQLEMIYGDFLKETGLDESRRDAVLDTLKERQGAQTDLGLSIFDPALSSAERKAAAARLALSGKEAEAKLKEALGAEYGKFEQFEKSTPERDQIASFSSMLKQKSLTLEDGTKKKLQEVMFEERMAFKFDRDLSDLKTVRPDNLTDAAVDHYLEQNAKLQQQVQAKAKVLLSPEQYEIFLKAQENQQQMAQTNLQWLRQLAGSGKEADTSN